MIIRQYKETAEEFNSYVLERVFEKDADALNFIYEKEDGYYVFPAGYLGGKAAEHGLKYILCNLPNLIGHYTMASDIVTLTYQDNSCSLVFENDEGAGKMWQKIRVSLGPSVKIENTQDPVGIALSRFKPGRS